MFTTGNEPTQFKNERSYFRPHSSESVPERMATNPSNEPTFRSKRQFQKNCYQCQKSNQSIPNFNVNNRKTTSKKQSFLNQTLLYVLSFTFSYPTGNNNILINNLAQVLLAFIQKLLAHTETVQLVIQVEVHSKLLRQIFWWQISYNLTRNSWFRFEKRFINQLVLRKKKTFILITL